MTLLERLEIGVLTLADWLDDRLTIAAIGLATGYFGFDNEQWASISTAIVAVATALLVVIPDPRKKVESQKKTAVARADAADDRAAGRLRDWPVDLPASLRNQAPDAADDNRSGGWGDR